jgi:hypothetical protein
MNMDMNVNNNIFFSLNTKPQKQLISQINKLQKSVNNLTSKLTQLNPKTIVLDPINNNETFVILPYLLQKDNGSEIKYSNNTSHNVEVYSNIQMYNKFFAPNGTNKIILKPNEFLICIFNYTTNDSNPHWHINLL